MNHVSSYEHSRRNLQAAHETLRAFLRDPVVTDRDRAGVIQAFEFTFELAWKTLQKYAGLQGVDVNGPRPSLKEAVKFGFIDLAEEDAWLAMLKDRNLSSHTYKRELAVEIVERVAASHFQALVALSGRLPVLGETGVD